MASRAEQKAAARKEREALQSKQASDAKRRQRLWIVGGVLGLAVVVIAVAIAVSSSNKSSETGLAPSSGQQTIINNVDGELSGLPQSAMTIGSPKAPVTIHYFGDLECSQCQNFTLNTLPTLLAKDVYQGRVKIVYHSLETASGSNPDSTAFQRQQVAALAAGKQNKAWNFIELFYNEQGPEGTGYVTPAYLTSIAKQAGLNLSQWNTDQKDPTLQGSVQTDAQTAAGYGFNATPSFYIVGPKSTTQVSGVVPYSQIEQSIQQVG
jgi:protein-disulfide isomerase